MTAVSELVTDTPSFLLLKCVQNDPHIQEISLYFIEIEGRTNITYPEGKACLAFIDICTIINCINETYLRLNEESFLLQ
jgi:hypothetical protein